MFHHVIIGKSKALQQQVTTYRAELMSFSKHKAGLAWDGLLCWIPGDCQALSKKKSHHWQHCGQINLAVSYSISPRNQRFFCTKRGIQTKVLDLELFRLRTQRSVSSNGWHGREKGRGSGRMGSAGPDTQVKTQLCRGARIVGLLVFSNIEGPLHVVQTPRLGSMLDPVPSASPGGLGGVF